MCFTIDYQMGYARCAIASTTLSSRCSIARNQKVEVIFYQNENCLKFYSNLCLSAIPSFQICK